MSTVEEFENATAGSTATAPDGERAIRTEDEDHPWWTSFGAYNDHYEMAYYNYVLDPPMPTTAREALDLAWELASPVKRGQPLPMGIEYIKKYKDNTYFHAIVSASSYVAAEWDEKMIRTIEPFLESIPEWKYAPAVLASHPLCADTEVVGLWIPELKNGEPTDEWKWPNGEFSAHWSELENVTPLWPEEGKES